MNASTMAAMPPQTKTTGAAFTTSLVSMAKKREALLNCCTIASSCVIASVCRTVVCTPRARCVNQGSELAWRGSVPILWCGTQGCRAQCSPRRRALRRR